MSEDRHLTEEDRDKIVRLLESGTLENQNLALGLIEQTAGQEDIAEIFTMNVIVELICLKGPESLEAMVRAGHLILKSPETWKVFSEAVVDQAILTHAITAKIREHLAGYGESSHGDFTRIFSVIEDEAAKLLAGPDFHYDLIDLSGLTSLSDAAAESLSKHLGELFLNGLTSLSDAAAESLSKHSGELQLWGLESLLDSPGHVALAEKLGTQHDPNEWSPPTLCLQGLTELSTTAARKLALHPGKLSLDHLTEVSDETALALGNHCPNLPYFSRVFATVELKNRLRKLIRLANAQARAALATGKSNLTLVQEKKIRKLLRTKNADNVAVAVNLLQVVDTTPDDLSAVFSSSIVSLMVNTWNVAVWNEVSAILASHKVALMEFHDLATRRFGGHETKQQNSFLSAAISEVQAPLVPLLTTLVKNARDGSYFDYGTGTYRQHDQDFKKRLAEINERQE